MQTVEKMNKVVFTDVDEGKLYVTHVTVRQSIFFLVLRLCILEILAAVLVILFHSILFASQTAQNYTSLVSLFMLPVYSILVVIKLIIMLVIIVQWLEDYYEITTKEVIHKKGLLFHNEERFTVKHLGAVSLQQGLLGRIFHFGTISIYDWVKGKSISLYLIHNPIKYHAILRHIIPEADKEEHILREHFIENDSDIV